MIRHADVVVVLGEEGKIVAQGSFDEVSLNPLFRQLVGLDRRQQEDAEEQKQQEQQEEKAADDGAKKK
jgi:hypothetical protein